MKIFNTCIFTFIFIAFFSCKKDENLSDKKELLSFSIKEQLDSTIIDKTNFTITIAVASNVNIAKLVPSIEISEKASVIPKSGDTVDFSSSPVEFKITAEDKSTQIWKVVVTKIKSDKKELLTYSLAEQLESAVIDKTNFTITITVSNGANVKSLVPTITISEKASIAPKSGDAVDFSSPVDFTITAEDKSTQIWKVVVSKKEELKSDKKELLTFSLAEQLESAIIDKTKFTITITVPNSANVKSLVPTITISEKASIEPKSGHAVDFSSSPVDFTVTAEDKSTQIWKVIVNLSTQTIVPNLNNFSILAFAVDNTNRLWVGTNKGLFYSVENGYIQAAKDINDSIYALNYEAESGLLWISSSKGLATLSVYAANSLEQFVAASNFISNNIITSYFNSASKWFGTNMGLSLNMGNTWKSANFKKTRSGTIIPLDFEDSRVNSISSWDGDYYFATSGRALYRGSNWVDSIDAFSGASQWVSPYNGSAVTSVMYVVFVDSKGRQWMGGTNGVQYHTGHDSKSNYVSFISELVNPLVHAIAEAPDGKIWIGTENGISIYDGTSWTTYSKTLPSGFVNAIVFKSGKTYIGTKKGLVIE